MSFIYWNYRFAIVHSGLYKRSVNYLRITARRTRNRPDECLHSSATEAYQRERHLTLRHKDLLSYTRSREYLTASESSYGLIDRIGKFAGRVRYYCFSRKGDVQESLTPQVEVDYKASRVAVSSICRERVIRTVRLDRVATTFSQEDSTILCNIRTEMFNALKAEIVVENDVKRAKLRESEVERLISGQEGLQGPVL